MPDAVLLLIQQVIVMFLLMMVGFTVYKAKMIQMSSVAHLSNIVLYVATPAAIISSFLSEFDLNVLRNAGRSFGLAILMTAVSIALTQTVMRRKSDLAKFAVIFSNVGFLGIPLAQMVLGGTSVFYMAMIVVWMSVLTFTYGIYLLSKNRALISVKKIISNPVIVSVAVGVVLYFAQIQLPAPIVRTIQYLNGLNAPVAMMILGCYLAEADIRGMFRNQETYYVLSCRLICVPLIMLVIMRLLPASFTEIKAVMVIAASTPIAAALAMLSQQYGGDYSYASALISVSTVLSLITMPVFLALLG